MGIFSNASFNTYSGGSNLNDTIESIMEDSSIEAEDIEDFSEAGMNAVIETERNYNSIMEAVAFQELQAWETTGEDFVVTENAISDMFAAIKRFILKIWDKIKSIFKSFIMKFDSWSKSDKEFINKYKKELFRKDLTDFEFKGYKNYSSSADMGGFVTAFDNMIKATNLTTAVTSFGFTLQSSAAQQKLDRDDIDTFRDKFDDNKEKLNGAIVTASGKVGSVSTCDSKEFTDYIWEVFRGDTEKDTLDKLDPNTIAAILQTNIKKSANDAFKGVKTTVNAALKEAENDEKAAIKNLPDTTAPTSGKKDNEKQQIYNYASAKLSIIRYSKEALLKVNGIMLQALKEASRQNKAIVTKMVSYNRSKSESAYTEGWQHSEGTSYLSNVNLV